MPTTNLDALSLDGALSVAGATTLTGQITAPAGILVAGVTITGDGAITIVPNGKVRLSKGSAAAITVAAPTNTTHDWYVIQVFSTTAFAHVITSSVDGFNAKGSSGTITLGGAIGDGFTLVGFGGHWYVTHTKNATVA